MRFRFKAQYQQIERFLIRSNDIARICQSESEFRFHSIFRKTNSLEYIVFNGSVTENMPKFSFVCFLGIVVVAAFADGTSSAEFCISPALASANPFAHFPDCPDLRIFPRDRWLARPVVNPNAVQALQNAAFLVIHHSNTTECFTHGNCANQMRRLQSEHQTSGLNDIAYNFLITSSGAVYEGRGWKVQVDGPTAQGYVERSVSIALHGTFETILPRTAAMTAYESLVECGKMLQVFVGDEEPTVIGHRQIGLLNCPGTALYKYISTWPNFEPNPQ